MRSPRVLAAVFTLVLAGATVTVPSPSTAEVRTTAPAVQAPQAQARLAPCDPGGNKVVCENSKPGSPPSEWEIDKNRGDTIEGFATRMSVNVGETVEFKVRTPSTDYRLDIYRIGYYGGLGARKQATVTPSATLPQNQPACLERPATGLIDCGNWGVSASWAVPADAVSGVYVVRLVRQDAANPEGDDEAHVVFIVRDDASTSDLLFQTSDTTWQAYNDWGGNSLYKGTSQAAPDRAVKVSYNRPFATRTGTPWGRDFLFANEYPMIRFLEANGYDISYTSGIDTDIRGNLLLNHKVFLSVGHDEYWSKNQRAYVEAARDAGVNLAFFSGNEVFWKTRWEPSDDGTNTPHRTLVTYRETRAAAKIDPHNEWTGTWRDPRFSPPHDGGRPENSLTGQLWTVNCCNADIEVPAADGKMRFWRNTDIATLPAGQKATLPDGTLGYEWDEDPDNGFRPAGSFRLSTTTHQAPEVIQDYGFRVAAAEATHHLTTYRAASGALVFGAGTVQWSWGLDENHDWGRNYNNRPAVKPPVDRRMRQATVNLFADMNVQPGTLQTGAGWDLVPATASDDTVKPTSTITSPAPGATLDSGTQATITGTAADTGGTSPAGRVAAVEVSTDGGTTWRIAQGRENWSYTWSVVGNGPVTIKTRAVDDTGNLEVPGAGRAVNVACPCGLFGDSATPKNHVNNNSPIEVGVKFQSQVNGWIGGVQFYKGPSNTGRHTGTLWTAQGALLATGTFENETASGWQTLTFPTAVPITAGTTYVVSVFNESGWYANTPDMLRQAPILSPPLIAPSMGEASGNGVFRSGSAGFPQQTYQGTNYWVDPVFHTVEPPDVRAPAVTAASPYPNASSVALNALPAVTFDEPIAAGSATVTVKDAANNTVAGTAALDQTSRILTFTPAAQFANTTTYTVTVGGARDASNNAMTTPYEYSFKTVKPTPAPTVCPCGIWNDSVVPPAASVQVNDATARQQGGVELGVRFKATRDGFINGIRFYKGVNNTGTHVGKLWSSAGVELAQATFTGESSTGWQEVLFANPVPVQANLIYTASYHTTVGWYSAAYNTMSNGVTNTPLRAMAHVGEGGNGVYKYGASSYPTTSANTNYFVDVVYDYAADTTLPQVESAYPRIPVWGQSGETNVATGTVVRATFDEPVTGATITVTPQGGSPIAGTAAMNGQVLTFTPAAPLAAATRHTIKVIGAVDAASNAMLDKSWSFTTSGTALCPCTLFSSAAAPATVTTADNAEVNLGTKFTVDTAGYITGVRFYKGPQNTGVHYGGLWTANGTLLTKGKFKNETANGWQTLAFSAPIAVVPGTTYVASYHAPNGRYSSTGSYFTTAATNSPVSAPASAGVFSYGPWRIPTSSYQGGNYWVDPIFVVTSPGDAVAPELNETDALDGETSVPAAANVTAVFNEAIAPATLQFTLTGPGGAVAGAVSYDAATRTATFNPDATLAANTTYTANVSGAADPSGNVMSPIGWSFKTAKDPVAGCPCSIWPDTARPAVRTDSDPAGVVLGVKFRSTQNGWITGIRFYKGPQNTGTHVGTLWAADGTKLAEATFANESTAGWQQVNFTTPVQVTAGTTYVASYRAPVGKYSHTPNVFNNGGVDSPPLRALASGEDGPNSVYRYGANAFPTNASNANYWVDVVFSDTAP
ncbi:DUF4082 domain-containing protein [Rhizohabitans arisaemae]|uniref:DUF4082 domain-containing protein n=1 Tax=Rhizohabitans arisaemae TaxID=2720610 RepID=UPI0024B0B71E|nr:DUF4082 domain-containing protein [Rhizohabitans arisaemae]